MALSRAAQKEITDVDIWRNCFSLTETNYSLENG
jgi:hypothetical protein